MEHPRENALPAPESAPVPAAVERAARLALPADAGHFDELHGSAADAGTAPQGLAPGWATFFEALGPEGFGDLDRRQDTLRRQIRDNGISYNVYADASGPQRPWSLDLFPLIVAPGDWRHIERGIQQRVRLLERIAADVYGPRELLRAGLLPAALIRGHPGYLRPMVGVEPVGGTRLRIAAFDLARGPDGHWWVVSQRTQAPSGLGYLLENRVLVSRLFPQAFEGLQVQRLAATYRALIDGLKQASPGGADAHIALLTPGPYNETYFEHAYLARYLGLTLVEGSDLTVRDERLYLRTLRGLEPVHGLLKRLDDDFLDPLELRADSTLGVPGLLQAIRAGQVLVANQPGSAILESSALLGFLPALAEHLLGEALALPSLPTWWCGEQAAREAALPRLAECVIKPTYPGWASRGHFEAVLGGTLDSHGRGDWADRIRQDGEAHTVQGYLPPSQVPTWTDGRIEPRAVILRVFAIADGPQSWRVLPGGLARLVSSQGGMASMQRGGSSVDVWIPVDRARGETVDGSSLLAGAQAPTGAHRRRQVTSRAAENLFWLGRYTERAENTIRLARLTLDCLNGEDPASPALLAWLGDMADRNTLVLPGVPGPQAARRVFERSLIASLDSRDQVTSIGFNLRALKLAASSVRERLSQEHWNVITQAEADFARRCQSLTAGPEYPAVEALRILDDASGHMAAITGAQTDRMTRDDGWRLLSIGRHIERLSFHAPALSSALDARVLDDDAGFEALIALFDSTITFHAQYQRSRDLAALLDLLVLDRDNPRSLAWVLQTLRGRLARLAGCAPGELDPMALRLPDPSEWRLEALARPAEPATPGALAELLARCTEAAWRLSEDVGLRYFRHATDAGHSLGAP